MALLRSIGAREGRELLFGEGEGPFSGWSKSKERLDARVARRRAGARLGHPLRPDEELEPGDALAPWTLHDLRRTVVTGMNELGVQPHVVEAVVNHVSGRAKGRGRGSFASALLGYRHEPVVAWVFILALGLTGVSLVYLAQEVRLGVDELELYR